MHFLKQPNPEKLSRQLRDRKISRREFNATAAAAGVAFMSLPIGEARATAGQMINYFTWSGYEVPELHQPFIDKHGQSPDTSIFASAEDGLQKIRAGYAPDLAHPCINDVRKWLECSAPGSLDTSLSHAAGLIEIVACHA